MSLAVLIQQAQTRAKDKEDWAAKVQSALRMRRGTGNAYFYVPKIRGDAEVLRAAAILFRASFREALTSLFLHSVVSTPD